MKFDKQKFIQLYEQPLTWAWGCFDGGHRDYVSENSEAN